MFGDPAMLVVPALGLAVLTIVIFSLGAPGRPEVLVSAFAAPPADAFADAGITGLVERSTAATWAVLSWLAVLRGILFGLIAAMAVLRATEATPSIGAAARRMRRRLPSLVALAGLAMGYAHVVSGGGRIEPGREAGVAGTALVVGMLVFPAAFVAAVADDRGLLGAVRRSGRWILRRPVGHLLLVAGYALAFGGTIRLALFGEVARPRALPVVLYALVAALVTTTFTAAVARRYVLLHSDEVLAPEHAARAAARRAKRLARMARRGARRAKRSGSPAAPPADASAGKASEEKKKKPGRRPPKGRPRAAEAKAPATSGRARAKRKTKTKTKAKTKTK